MTSVTTDGINDGHNADAALVRDGQAVAAIQESGSSNSRVTPGFRAGDVHHCAADITKAKKLLGYAPAMTFEEGMRELVAWGGTVAASDGFDRAYRELRVKGLVEG
jgi:dTDP-L-rhamnose 4-epimerase